MIEAYIFDAVRTPRGKGKKDGSLHQATPVWLLRTLLQGLQQRHNLDTSLVDDVILGCVTPVGEQGADIARTAVLDSGWAESVAGVTLSRFCASGLEAINMAAAKIRAGLGDMVVAGGVESMSRWPMGSDGGAWVMDPRINSGTAFVPQGISADLIATLEGFSRADLDAYAGLKGVAELKLDDVDFALALFEGEIADSEIRFGPRRTLQATLTDDSGRLGLRFDRLSLPQQAELAAMTFARADAWVSTWGTGQRDRPLASLKGVLAIGVHGIALLASSHAALGHFRRRVAIIELRHIVGALEQLDALERFRREDARVHARVFTST